MKLIDITGQRFGRLTAIERAENSRAGRTRYRFKCDCGNEIVATANSVRTSNTKSCGCLRRDMPGHLHPNFRHGMTDKLPEY
jgi:hypothetical protein